MKFENGKVILTGTLAVVDLLECTICCNNLSTTVFQCEFGHCVCERCWYKLGYICPTCKRPLGVNRCKIVESLIRNTVMRCPNAPICEKILKFPEITKHVNDGCPGSSCYCPYHVVCSEKGDAEWIVDHFLNSHWPTEKYKSFFEYDTEINLRVINTLDVWYLFCWNSEVLFAYQCFKEDEGVWVDVTCIAPPASDIYNFSYVLTYTIGDEEITYVCQDMLKRVRMVYGYPNRSTAFFIPKTHLESDELPVVVRIN